MNVWGYRKREGWGKKSAKTRWQLAHNWKAAIKYSIAAAHSLNNGGLINGTLSSY